MLTLGAYLTVLFVRGGHRAWGRFGVRTLSSPFLDMRSVRSAWECARRGVAVLPANPCDPLSRPANYPAVWLLPSHLGLGQSSTVPLGVVTAIVFFAAALAVIPRVGDAYDGLVYGLALCSPSVMLGVERGNVDLLIFALVVLAVALLRRAGRAAIASPLLLLFAAILKLFPIVAAPVFFRLHRRQGFVPFSAVVAAFGIYALATLGTIREIRRAVPQPTIYAYGINPFGDWASNLFATYRIHLAGSVWDWHLVGLTLAFAVVMQPHLRSRLDAQDGDPSGQRDLDFFIAGAVIYVATFCLFQNFEYRLVFLLLTIPQLLRWARERHALGSLGLLLVLLTLWLGALWAGVPIVDTLMSRWRWLTNERPFFGVDRPLSAVASAQVMLAVVLLTLLAATPEIAIRRRPRRST